LIITIFIANIYNLFKTESDNILLNPVLFRSLPFKDQADIGIFCVSKGETYKNQIHTVYWQKTPIGENDNLILVIFFMVLFRRKFFCIHTEWEVFYYFRWDTKIVDNMFSNVFRYGINTINGFKDTCRKKGKDFTGLRKDEDIVAPRRNNFFIVSLKKEVKSIFRDEMGMDKVRINFFDQFPDYKMAGKKSEIQIVPSR